MILLSQTVTFFIVFGLLSVGCWAETIPHAVVRNFLLTPDQPAVLQLPAAAGSEEKTAFVILNYQSERVTTGEALKKAGQWEIPLQLPTGYFEVTLPELRQTYGVDVMTAYEGAADPFYSIDTAISWLTKPEQRAALIDNLVPVTGKEGLARERLSWSAINPAEGSWNWETAREYESTRLKYAKAGVKLLEMFHDAPSWMGRMQKGTFPENLPAADRSWSEVAQRWNSYWSALEVWNEPDLASLGGNQPSEQYVPIVKTIRHSMRAVGVNTPMGGGVFASMSKCYLDLAAANGLIDECDYISFHYYGDPLGVERLVGQFRDWLRSWDRESKPLWMTEVGRPWPGRTGTRPSPNLQQSTALTYAMQSVEARACGVERYFPFVYVEYGEHSDSNHFGMLDHNGAPLRSYAALVQARRALSGTSYVGDIAITAMPTAKRIRAFAPSASGVDENKASMVLVVYTGKAVAGATLNLPFAVESAQGIDGRPLAIKPPATIPIPDGLTYVYAASSVVNKSLVTNTEAMRLYKLSKNPAPALPPVSDIVLQPEMDLARVQAMSSRGYFLKPDTRPLPIKVWVNNLGKEIREVRLRAGKLAETSVTVAPGSRQEAMMEIDLAKLPDGESDAKKLQITASSAKGGRIAPVELWMLQSGDDKGVAGYLQGSKYQFALALGEDYRWEKNANGPMTYEHQPPAIWGFKVQFPKATDRWAYPSFAVPQEVDYTKLTGVLVRARCMQPATVRLMTWDEAGVNSSTSFPIFAADGAWHVAYIPFASYRTKVNEKFVRISIGFNSKTDTNALEISDLYLLGK